MCWDWFKTHEWLAVWLEGIALLAILFADSLEYRAQGKERKKLDKDREEARKQFTDQLDVARRQIHSDRVAQIFETMSDFADSMVDRVLERHWEPGDTYHWFDPDTGGEGVMKEYAAIQHARNLAILINPPLAAYIGERIAEADTLSNCPDQEELAKRFKIFRANWEDQKMAEAIRQLS
jgi:hypothetical protein